MGLASGAAVFGSALGVSAPLSRPPGTAAAILAGTAGARLATRAALGRPGGQLHAASEAAGAIHERDDAQRHHQRGDAHQHRALVGGHVVARPDEQAGARRLLGGRLALGGGGLGLRRRGGAPGGGDEVGAGGVDGGERRLRLARRLCVALRLGRRRARTRLHAAETDLARLADHRARRGGLGPRGRGRHLAGLGPGGLLDRDGPLPHVGDLVLHHRQAVDHLAEHVLDGGQGGAGARLDLILEGAQRLVGQRIATDGAPRPRRS